MKIAIIGLGHRGQKFLRAAMLCVDAKVVAVCDPMVTQLQDENVRLYQDLDTLLANESIDIAIVAVPHHLYLPIITTLAEHKVHIIKEKPFAEDELEAKAMHHVLQANQVEMMIAVQRRFDKLYQVFKQMLGTIGDISHIRGSYTLNIDRLDEGWRASRQQAGGGALSDLGYHFIDLLVWYFGLPSDISCFNTRNSRSNQDYNVEDSTFLNFEYLHQAEHLDKKTIGSFFLSRVSVDVGESITVQGQLGCLRLTPSAIEFFDIHNKPIRKLVKEEANTLQPLVNMIEHFVHYLRGDIPTLTADYRSHAQHVSIVRAAYQADQSYSQTSYSQVKSRLLLSSPKARKRLLRSAEQAELTLEVPPPVKRLAAKAPDYVWPIITEQTKAAILEQVTAANISRYNRSGIVEAFERNFADYHGRQYALSTNSGTSAIHALYHAIGCGPGDEVLVPSNTFHATISPLMHTGATPVFVDCGQNGNMDPVDLARKICSKTKAVMVTHMWGIPCEMDAIVRLCRENGVILLEDCSHAHGARYKGRLVGTFGDAAAWSLNGPKIVSGGEGGILLTDHQEIEIRANLLGQYNKRSEQVTPKDHALRELTLTGYGLKHRITTVAAAMANEQFQHLDQWLKYKRLYAGMFRDALRQIPFIELPQIDDCEPAWYAFPFYIKDNEYDIDRDQFLALCHDEGLEELKSPGSTMPQERLALYRQPSRYLPHLYPADPPLQSDCLQSLDRYRRCIKMPMWAHAEDLGMVNKYLQGILAVSRRLSQSMQVDPMAFTL